MSLALMLRRGEVLVLRWSDLDLNQKTPTVNQQLQRVDGRRVNGEISKLVFCEPKSRNNYRTIPLPEFVVEALQRHPRRNSELVFATPKGTPVEPRRFDKMFKVILMRAGLPIEMKLHSARHFGLSLLASLGFIPRPRWNWLDTVTCLRP